MNLISNENNYSFVFIDIDQIRNFTIINLKIKNENYYQIHPIGNCKKYYVLKITKRVNYENTYNFLIEYEIQQLLKHRNILKTFNIFLNDSIYLHSILYENWQYTLDQRIKMGPLTNVELNEFLYQIAEGMKYVHSKNIIHRNLNHQSIVLKNNEIKITKFDLSIFNLPDEQLDSLEKDRIDSMEYTAPEIKYNEIYDEKVNVYSFGMIVLFFVNKGTIPNSLIKSNRIVYNSLLTTYWTDFINQCINCDPHKRPSFEIICNTMSLNFYSLISISQSEKKRNEIIY